MAPANSSIRAVCSPLSAFESVSFPLDGEKASRISFTPITEFGSRVASRTATSTAFIAWKAATSNSLLMNAIQTFPRIRTCKLSFGILRPTSYRTNSCSSLNLLALRLSTRHRLLPESPASGTKMPSRSSHCHASRSACGVSVMSLRGYPGRSPVTGNRSASRCAGVILPEPRSITRRIMNSSFVPSSSGSRPISTFASGIASTNSFTVVLPPLPNRGEKT